MIAAVRGRLWRAYADGTRMVRHRGSAGPALAGVDARRRDAEAWIAATAQHHDEYRRRHPAPDERVALICVSNRPHLVDRFVANATTQHHGDLDVVFVATGGKFDRAALERSLRLIDGVRIDETPSDTSLGAALNRGMAMTDARFVAKIDDDDLYGPHYISDALRAHSYAGAGVVGKHSHFAYLEQRDETILRFPQNEFRYSSTLSGGTLVIDRDRVDDQRFVDVSIGEDRAFITQCHRRGISTFSADRFNFVQTRHGNNTWTIPDAQFVDKSRSIGPGLNREWMDR